MNTIPHVSGYERELSNAISNEFYKYAEMSIDNFGNLIAHKQGRGPRVMLSAHMDEIGMVVTAACDGGFLKFSCIGGIDVRNILAQEVTVYGRKPIFGVIGIKPPHLINAGDKTKIFDINNLTIDTGYPLEKLNDLVRPGDIVTINQDIAELHNGKLTGKALDNLAGIAVLYCVLKNLENFNHNADVYLVASAQEEVGCRGAKTAVYTIKPDIGIAIDVTYGRTNDLSEHESWDLGKGPVIAIGPYINRSLFQNLKQTAMSANTPFQIEVLPTKTGTDADVIQIGARGVITGLLSIPLKYMHSTVETVAICDIENCGKLISDYIMSLQKWEKEPCY